MSTETPVWKYPEHDGPAPGGNLLLLTIGHTPIFGPWRNDGSVIAYFPIPARDRDKEA